MTREEKEIALYCLKAGSDYHSEVCEECVKYLKCNRTIQDDITETVIKALEQEPILEKDGTLVVTTEHYENVGRVLVQHGTSGTLFYQDREPCEGAKYEEDTNKLKEQILKEGSNLISKRDLLKRFDKVDKEYKGRPWNFLQIPANINILIGQEPCEDCVSRKEVEKLCYKFLSKSTDNNVAFFEHLIELPSVNPTSNLDKIRAEIKALSPEPTAFEVVDGNPIKEAVWETIADALQIIDKYKE